MHHETLLPVEFLRPGEWGDVAEVTGQPDWVCRLAELGVRTGCRVQMLQTGNPCLLLIGGGRLSLRIDPTWQVLVRPARLAG